MVCFGIDHLDLGLLRQIGRCLSARIGNRQAVRNMAKFVHCKHQILPDTRIVGVPFIMVADTLFLSGQINRMIVVAFGLEFFYLIAVIGYQVWVVRLA